MKRGVLCRIENKKFCRNIVFPLDKATIMCYNQASNSLANIYFGVTHI
nr:MAG TPA: hypothetical protein [Caudoviricetes sp.]